MTPTKKSLPIHAHIKPIEKWPATAHGASRLKARPSQQHRELIPKVKGRPATDDDAEAGKKINEKDRKRLQSTARSLALMQAQHQDRKKQIQQKKMSQSAAPGHKSVATVLQRGNSDPFSAAAITITPLINQILVFARDVCLPAFYFVDSLRDTSDLSEPSRDVTNSTGWISSPAAKLGWQQVIDALEDKCTALSCLSTHLALMASCNINTARTTEASLKLRAASSALMRQNLLQPRDRDVRKQQELLWQVFWHFYAEFFAGNVVAAQIHGKMIRQTCETAEEGVVTEHFLDSVVFVDTQMSAKYMTRTVLDIENWLPKLFSPIWQQIDPNIAEMTNETGEGLDSSIASEPLKSIVIRTRQLIIMLDQPEISHSHNINLDTLYYWLNSHAYVDSGLLIDNYLNLVEHTFRRPSSSLARIYTDAAISTALLYVIRDIGHEIRINKIDIVDASSTIIHHLRVSLEHAYMASDKEEKLAFRNAHLWCACIGALAEQRAIGSKQFSTTNSIPWFGSLLAEIAHGMGILSWGQATEVFKKFLYTDAVEPHGSRWFWSVMGTYLDRMDRPKDKFVPTKIVKIPGNRDPLDIANLTDGRLTSDTSLSEQKTQEQIRQQRFISLASGPRPKTPMKQEIQSIDMAVKLKLDQKMPIGPLVQESQKELPPPLEPSPTRNSHAAWQQQQQQQSTQRQIPLPPQQRRQQQPPQRETQQQPPPPSIPIQQQQAQQRLNQQNHSTNSSTTTTSSFFNWDKFK